MKDQTKINLFIRYCDYWIVKLGLDKKYKIEVKKDNRINCYACVFRRNEDGVYMIRYNTKMFSSRMEILHVLLHELGHLFYDFRIVDEVYHEYHAELFALKTIKEFYPRYYKKAIQACLRDMNDRRQDQVHREAYQKVLKELGEL